MFTGIVETMGTVRRIDGGGGSFSLAVEIAAPPREIKPGDSVAVDGVCLTATSFASGVAAMDVGEETFRRTTLSALRPGGRVNIETALTLEKPLGGHFVSGHVDAVGTIKAVVPSRTQREVRIEFPEALEPLIVEKGGVAVDGISLTVGAVRDGWFAVYLIPHSWENTTLSFKKPGAKVNLEADLLARYVMKILSTMNHPGGGGNFLNKLREYGYMDGK